MHATADPASAGQTDIATLLEVTEAAAAVFTDLPRRSAAITYLRQRGIGASVLSPDWVIGYAPPGWTRLVNTLHGKFPDQALVDAGVARWSSRGTLIDTFRNRVMFGISSQPGTIRGFIGRDLSGDPNAPKYLNTRQHALFDKSRLLFGLHEGTAHTSAGQPVVVEGPIDVLAIAARQQPGDDAPSLLPVAACGTAFTPAHARQVADHALEHGSPVVVAMDGDAAGRAAALDAGERLRHLGVDVRIAVLPNGSDPAEYLAQPDSSLAAFHADSGLPLLTLQVEKAIARQSDRMQWVEGRLAALRSLGGYLATYPPSFTARQVAWLADTLGLDTSTVTFEVAESYRRADLARTAIAAPNEPRGQCQARSIGGGT